MNENDLPLSGIVVLDFSQFLAGPSCALRLADFGADVIKVERPQGGDACRQLAIANQTLGADSVLFHTINRNKRSFSADLKSPAEMQRVKTLIARADVMVHNFRPGVMDRLGLGWDAVQAINPRIVYAAVSGYGSEGPWRDKPGQDLLAQSLSGLPWLNGDADQGPVPAGVPVADILTGAHLVQGVLAALVRRGRTGKGGRVDVSLLESVVDLQFEIFTAFLRTGKNPERCAVNNAGVVSAAPYGIYATVDGYLAIAMTPIDRLGELIDCAELAKYPDPQTWFAQRDQIKTVLKSHLVKQSTSFWLEKLELADVWCAEVMDWESLLDADGFKVIDMIQETHTSDAQMLRTTRCPVRIDGYRLKAPRGAPRLGEHTDEVWQQHGATI